MKRILVILCVLCGVANAQDAGTGSASSGPVYIDPHDLHGAPDVSAAASPTQVQIGARFVLIVKATYEDGVVVNLPATLDLGQELEERPGSQRKSSDSTAPDGRHVREWQIEVLPWDLGDLEIPPVQVTYTNAGAIGAVQTNAVPIKVVGQLGDLVDSAQPRDLAPPIPLWRRTWIWVLVGLGVILLVALIAVVFTLTRKKKGVTVIAPLPVRLSGVFRRRLSSAAEEALARLDAVDTSGMLARDRKIAYTEMIDIVQQFLGRHFGHDTEDMTGGELREWASTTKLDDTQRAQLFAWLDEAELVKFGGYPASVDEGRGQIADGKDVVLAIAAPRASALMQAEAPPSEAPHA
jgi:hypothetical protein